MAGSRLPAPALTPCRVGPHWRPRTAAQRRQIAHAEIAQPLHDPRLRGFRPELLEREYRAAQQRGIVTLGQGARLLIGTAKLVPDRGSMA